MRHITLPSRLGALLDMIGSPTKVADIGCDHGKLAAAIAVMGIPVIAGDISEPSLQKTVELKEELDLQNLETRLGDGLSAIGMNEVDLVIMAGIGQQTIMDILSHDNWKLPDARWLLQGMDGVAELRRYLDDRGYVMTDESLVEDRDRIYTIMDVRRGEREGIDEVQCHLGPRLLEERPPLFNKFLQLQIAKVRVIIAGLERASTPDEAQMSRYRALLDGYLEVRHGDGT